MKKLSFCHDTEKHERMKLMEKTQESAMQLLHFTKDGNMIFGMESSAKN